MERKSGFPGEVTSTKISPPSTEGVRALAWSILHYGTPLNFSSPYEYMKEDFNGIDPRHHDLIHTVSKFELTALTIDTTYMCLQTNRGGFFITIATFSVSYGGMHREYTLFSRYGADSAEYMNQLLMGKA